MPRTSPFSAPVAADDAHIDPIDLTPAQQQMLRTLADIDRSYDEARRKLERWSGPDALKQRFSEQLEARRQHERKPLLRRFIALEQQMRRAVMLKARPLH
jgi:hypothetical protein